MGASPQPPLPCCGATSMSGMCRRDNRGRSECRAKDQLGMTDELELPHSTIDQPNHEPATTSPRGSVPLRQQPWPVEDEPALCSSRYIPTTADNLKLLGQWFLERSTDQQDAPGDAADLLGSLELMGLNLVHSDDREVVIGDFLACAAPHAQDVVSDWFSAQATNRHVSKLNAATILAFLSRHGVQLMHKSHVQRDVHHRAWSARVDLALAPLVLAMWQRGIPTVTSCAGERPRTLAYLSFPAGPAGGATIASLLHEQLVAAVPSLAPDPMREDTSTLRWCDRDTAALQVAIQSVRWPSSLAWPTAQPVVHDFYDFYDWN